MSDSYRLGRRKDNGILRQRSREKLRDLTFKQVWRRWNGLSGRPLVTEAEIFECSIGMLEEVVWKDHSYKACKAFEALIGDSVERQEFQKLSLSRSVKTSRPTNAVGISRCRCRGSRRCSAYAYLAIAPAACYTKLWAQSLLHSHVPFTNDGGSVESR